MFDNNRQSYGNNELPHNQQSSASNPHNVFFEASSTCQMIFITRLQDPLGTSLYPDVYIIDTTDSNLLAVELL